MDGIYALIIAILGCQVKDCDLSEDEDKGMRRYPITAEDAFMCYEGKKYQYDSKNPDYYDYGEKYIYKKIV